MPDVIAEAFVEISPSGLGRFSQDLEEGIRRALEGASDVARRELGGVEDAGRRAFRNVEQEGNRATEGIGGAFKKLGAVAAGAFAGVAVGKFLKDSLFAAADLGESINAVKVTLGAAGESFVAFGADAATSLGLTQRELNDAVVPIGALLRNAGLEGAGLSSQLQALATRATDVGSVFNKDVNEVLSAFGGAIRGELDAVRALGVSFDDTTVSAKAVALGLAETTKEVSDGAKAQARLALILDQTASAAGDFQNTIESLPNALKVAKAQANELAVAFGTGLLPAASAGLGALNAELPGIKGSFTDLGASTGVVLASLVPLIPVLVDLAKSAFEIVAAVTPLVPVVTTLATALAAVLALGPVVPILTAIAGGFLAIRAAATISVLIEGAVIALTALASRAGHASLVLQGLSVRAGEAGRAVAAAGPLIGGLAAAALVGFGIMSSAIAKSRSEAKALVDQLGKPFDTTSIEGLRDQTRFLGDELEKVQGTEAGLSFAEQLTRGGELLGPFSNDIQDVVERERALGEAVLTNQRAMTLFDQVLTDVTKRTTDAEVGSEAFTIAQKALGESLKASGTNMVAVAQELAKLADKGELTGDLLSAKIGELTGKFISARDAAVKLTQETDLTALATNVDASVSASDALAAAMDSSANAAEGVAKAQAKVNALRSRGLIDTEALARAEDALVQAIAGEESAITDLANSAIASEAAHQRQIDATRGVEDAQIRAADAVRGLEDAEDRRLSALDVRAEAERRLTDLISGRVAAEASADASRDVERAGLGARSAVLRLRAAQERLVEVQGKATSSTDDLESAQLSVDEASLSLRDAQDRVKESQDSLATAQAIGTEGSKELIAATRDLAVADDGVAEANRGVDTATRGVETANLAVEASQRTLTGATRDLSTAYGAQEAAERGVITATGEVVTAETNLQSARQDSPARIKEVQDAEELLRDAKSRSADASRDLRLKEIDLKNAVADLRGETADANTKLRDLIATQLELGRIQPGLRTELEKTLAKLTFKDILAPAFPASSFGNILTGATRQTPIETAAQLGGFGGVSIVINAASADANAVGVIVRKEMDSVLRTVATRR